ncbi:hypothetical protein HYQ45_003971 [Verticillium longisporum]|uniref:Uncharacterized protein n=1 Tax=Verticillium longisporum TaxID=100787 RepID=A0A8I3AUY1_VERLO|nr:hypothetical protein HYQ45_003971 [Verticillium longisporum]
MALNPSKTPLHSRSILLLTISYAPTARGRIAVATSFEPVLYCARRLFYPTSSRHSLARPVRTIIATPCIQTPDLPLLSSLSGLARQVRSTSGTVQYALERPF